MLKIDFEIDMEMPRNCLFCPFCELPEMEYDYICQIDKRIKMADDEVCARMTRRTDCPLKES